MNSDFLEIAAENLEAPNATYNQEGLSFQATAAAFPTALLFSMCIAPALLFSICIAAFAAHVRRRLSRQSCNSHVVIGVALMPIWLIALYSETLRLLLPFFFWIGHVFVLLCVGITLLVESTEFTYTTVTPKLSRRIALSCMVIFGLSLVSNVAPCVALAFLCEHNLFGRPSTTKKVGMKPSSLFVCALLLLIPSLVPSFGTDTDCILIGYQSYCTAVYVVLLWTITPIVRDPSTHFFYPNIVELADTHMYKENLPHTLSRTLHSTLEVFEMVVCGVILISTGNASLEAPTAIFPLKLNRACTRLRRGSCLRDARNYLHTRIQRHYDHLHVPKVLEKSDESSREEQQGKMLNDGGDCIFTNCCSERPRKLKRKWKNRRRKNRRHVKKYSANGRSFQVSSRRRWRKRWNDELADETVAEVSVPPLDTLSEVDDISAATASSAAETPTVLSCKSSSKGGCICGVPSARQPVPIDSYVEGCGTRMGKYCMPCDPTMDIGLRLVSLDVSVELSKDNNVILVASNGTTHVTRRLELESCRCSESVIDESNDYDYNDWYDDILSLGDDDNGDDNNDLAESESDDGPFSRNGDSTVFVESNDNEDVPILVLGVPLDDNSTVSDQDTEGNGIKRACGCGCGCVEHDDTSTGNDESTDGVGICVDVGERDEVGASSNDTCGTKFEERKKLQSALKEANGKALVVHLRPNMVQR